MILPFLPKHLPCMRIINTQVYSTLWSDEDYVVKVFEKDVVQGFYMLKVSKDVIKIVRLLVDEDFKNKGIGSVLLEDIEVMGKMKNIRFLEVIVEEHNEKGLEWFLKKGFKGLGLKVEHFGLRDGYILRKQLW